MTVALLTLECHKESSWITKLVKSLELSNVEVSVIPIESLLEEPMLNNNDSLKRSTILVNRVSDAAEPHLVKACLAVMYQAELLGIKLFNGPRAYSFCTNKWCHHVLFQKAKLQHPRTIRLRTPLIGGKQRLLRHITDHFDSTVESFLLKPNSGGFGAGIVKFTRSACLTDSVEIPIYKDTIGLIQEYVKPRDGKIFRVWFLCSRVHCAVYRLVSSNDTRTELTQGCVGSCSRSQQEPSIGPYVLPLEVVGEIEHRLLPLVPEANAGSVEYLINNDGQRLYFDLNLLSTLPDKDLVQSVLDSDPWDDLASAILSMSLAS